MLATANRKWAALALLSVVQFMVVLDIAIVNVALPSIQIDLGFSQENLQWVISAYALVFGGFLLLGGRAADLLGRRRIFLAGLVVFSLSSLLAGFAWDEASLIGARALQGLADTYGTGNVSPLAEPLLELGGVEFTGQYYDSRRSGAVVVIAETEPVSGAPGEELLESVARVATHFPRS